MIKEKEYQHHLEKELNGKHLKNTHGITDITTEDTHVEIKKWSDYKSALGQLLSYNNAIPKENLSVYFFGYYPEEKKEMIIDLFNKSNINVYQCSIKVEPLKLIDVFINKFIIKSNTENCLCVTAWKTYVNWCKENGFIIIKQRDLENKIQEKFNLHYKKRVFEKGIRGFGWLNIKII